MEELLGVYCGKPKETTGFRFVEQIQSYNLVSDEQKSQFLGENPCVYVDMRGRQSSCRLEDIVKFTAKHVVNKLGYIFKVPEYDIKPL